MGFVSPEGMESLTYFIMAHIPCSDWRIVLCWVLSQFHLTHRHSFWRISFLCLLKRQVLYIMFISDFLLFGVSLYLSLLFSKHCFGCFLIAALGTLEFDLRYEQSSSELHCTMLRAKVSQAAADFIITLFPLCCWALATSLPLTQPDRSSLEASHSIKQVPSHVSSACSSSYILIGMSGSKQIN